MMQQRYKNTANFQIIRQLYFHFFSATYTWKEISLWWGKVPVSEAGVVSLRR